MRYFKHSVTKLSYIYWSNLDYIDLKQSLIDAKLSIMKVLIINIKNNNLKKLKPN